MNGLQRKCGGFTLKQSLNAAVYNIGAEVALNSVTFGVDLLVKKAGPPITFDCEELGLVYFFSILQ